MLQFPNTLPDNGDKLEGLIEKHEQSFAPLKEKNEARIVWADEATKGQTDYAIVYLHGFTASHAEGDPWHKTIAERFGCNLYLPRLHSHGLKQEDFFGDFSYPALIDSAIDACRIGKKLGKHLLIMGTSTGASLALYAAGSKYCPVKVEGLFLISPLIHFYGTLSLFLENKAGRFLAKLIRGKNYKQPHFTELTPTEENFWYPYIPLEAALTLGKMVEDKLTSSLFERVKCPVFVGYYNKNKFNHDHIVSPHAITQMFSQLGTQEAEKKLVNFSGAKTHVICSGLISKAIPELIDETVHFLEEKVGLETVEKS